MTALRVVEENERYVGTAVDGSEKEGSCGCGCGGGVVREASAIDRERAHSLETPEGPCGCDGSCGCDGVARS